MVIVGDVRFDQVEALAKKYLEPIPRQAPPPAVRTKEMEQKGERRVTLSKPAPLPILQVLYHVPETRNPDTPVLRVVQTLLSQGQSSRLYKRMVDGDQVALSVFGSVSNALDPTVFTFMVQPRSGVDPANAEKALYDELAKLGTQEVPPAELRKAKNQILANFYRQMKTINGRANAIGTYEVFFGDYHKLFNAADEYAKVTAADVQRVAKQYLNDKNRTVATLIPEKQEAGK